MKKLVLFSFIFSFIANISYANHHKRMNRDGEDFNNEGFYDEYNSRLDRRANHRGNKGKRYRLKKGEPAKKRIHQKRHKSRKHHQRMMNKVNKLPADKKKEALKEVRRHHGEMKKIVGDKKPPHHKRRPRRDFDKNKAKMDSRKNPKINLEDRVNKNKIPPIKNEIKGEAKAVVSGKAKSELKNKPKASPKVSPKEKSKFDKKVQDSLSNKKLRYFRPRMV